MEKEHNYLLNLFEGAPEGIVLCDKDQKVIQGNMESCRMFGYAPKEIMGQFLNKLVTAYPETPARYPFPFPEFPFRSGTNMPYTPSRDITTRKKAKEEQKRSYPQLEKAMGGTANVLVKVVETRDPLYSRTPEKSCGAGFGYCPGNGS